MARARPSPPPPPPPWPLPPLLIRSQLNTLPSSFPVGQSWKYPAISPSLRSKLASTCGTSFWASNTVSEEFPCLLRVRLGDQESAKPRLSRPQTFLSVSADLPISFRGGGARIGGCGLSRLHWACARSIAVSGPHSVWTVLPLSFFC
jgi:hypothetical protein